MREAQRPWSEVQGLTAGSRCDRTLPPPSPAPAVAKQPCEEDAGPWVAASSDGAWGSGANEELDLVHICFLFSPPL